MIATESIVPASAASFEIGTAIVSNRISEQFSMVSSWWITEWNTGRRGTSDVASSDESMTRCSSNMLLNRRLNAGRAAALMVAGSVRSQSAPMRSVRTSYSSHARKELRDEI